MSRISWAYLRQNLDKSQAYIWHVSGTSQAYLSHLSGISQGYRVFKERLNSTVARKLFYLVNPITDLQTVFLLKTDIHMQILNAEPILYDLRQPRYPKNKMELLG